MGSIAFIITAVVIVAAIVLLAGKVIDKLGYSRKIIDIVKKKLFWNTFLRTSLQAYIKVLFVYLTLAMSLKFDEFISAIKSLIIFMVLAILFALIPLYTILLYRLRNFLDNKTIRDKIGSLYIGM